MNSRELPLKHLKVLDVGNWVAGPSAATMLGDFGAEVIKIEAPGVGDVFRYLNLVDGLPGGTDAYTWIIANRNKRGLAIDVKQPQGYDAFIELVKQVDVVVTNYRPGLLARLKIRYEDLKPHNSSLVFAHLTGYGREGDEIDNPAFDRSSWWARSGLQDVARAEGNRPISCPLGMGDQATSVALFGAIMLGLFQREQTGEGSEVHASLTGVGAWANALNLQAALGGAESVKLDQSPENSTYVVMQSFCSSDDRWFTFFSTTDEAVVLKSVLEVFDMGELMDDSRFKEQEQRIQHAPALVAMIAEKVQDQTWSELKTLFDGAGIQYVLAVTDQEAISDPQLAANAVFRPLDDQLCTATHTVDSPMQIVGLEKVPAGHAPGVGEHSIQILEDYGFSEETIQGLLASGVVTDPGQPASKVPDSID